MCQKIFINKRFYLYSKRNKLCSLKIKPININDIDFVDKNLLLNLTYGPTYERISNSDLIKMIEQKFELEFNSTPRKFKTKYIEGDNLLLIDLNKEV